MHFFWYLKTLTKHKNSKQTGRQNKNRKNDKIKIANLDVEKKLHRIKNTQTHNFYVANKMRCSKISANFYRTC